LASNKDRLISIDEAAKGLLEEKPEYAPYITPKVKELTSHFRELEESTKEKVRNYKQGVAISLPNLPSILINN